MIPATTAGMTSMSALSVDGSAAMSVADRAIDAASINGGSRTNSRVYGQQNAMDDESMSPEARMVQLSMDAAGAAAAGEDHGGDALQQSNHTDGGNYEFVDDNPDKWTSPEESMMRRKQIYVGAVFIVFIVTVSIVLVVLFFVVGGGTSSGDSGGGPVATGPFSSAPSTTPITCAIPSCLCRHTAGLYCL